MSKKTQLKKELKNFKKLENKFKRRSKLKEWGTKGYISINWIGGKINKFLGKIKYLSKLPNQQRLKLRAGRDKRGIVIMESGFIDEIKEKVSGKEHHLKGKWLKINPTNQEEKEIRKMKSERKALVILMSKIREEKLKKNKISDPIYNAKMEKYRGKLEKIREELPFLESRLIKKQIINLTNHNFP